MPPIQLYSPHKKLKIFESQKYYFLCSKDEKSNTIRTLKIYRTSEGSNNSEPFIDFEQLENFPEKLTYDRIIERLKNIHPNEDIVFNSDAKGLIGFIKLVESYYMILITKSQKVGIIAGNYIYSIEKTNYLQISTKKIKSNEENKYKNMLLNMDLTKGFYFSYNYDLTNTLQTNCTVNKSIEKIYLEDMFIWNTFLLQPLLLSSQQKSFDSVFWTLPIIHGFFQQKLIESDDTERIRITLLARRSRRFAGTRYLRRGVNEQGFVANEVETEQIVSFDGSHSTRKNLLTSIVQTRGSIPIFWSHVNLLSPKPDIVIDDSDRTYSATRRHFHRLFNRFGKHVTVLSLIKQVEKTPKESPLGSSFGSSIGTINKIFAAEAYSQNNNQNGIVSSDSSTQDIYHIDYVTYDFLNNVKTARERGINVFDALAQISETIFPQIGFFVDHVNVFESNNSNDVHDNNDNNNNNNNNNNNMNSKSKIINNKHNNELINNNNKNNSELNKSNESTKNKIDELFDDENDDDDDDDDQIKLLAASISNIPDVKLPNDLFNKLMERFSNKDFDWSANESFQYGVLRTNCIDCLDRTNVAQFCFGKNAIIYQLKALGISFNSSSVSECERILMEMWAEHGDAMARQYGGSGAMHKVDVTNNEKDGEREFVLTGGAKNALVAVQRYYSNNFSDNERQQSMNLFLGINLPIDNKNDKFSFLESTNNLLASHFDKFSFEDQQQKYDMARENLQNEIKIFKFIENKSNRVLIDENFVRKKLTQFDKIFNYSFNIPSLQGTTFHYKHNRKNILNFPIKQTNKLLDENQNKLIDENDINFITKIDGINLFAEIDLLTLNNKVKLYGDYLRFKSTLFESDLAKHDKLPNEPETNSKEWDDMLINENDPSTNPSFEKPNKKLTELYNSLIDDQNDQTTTSKENNNLTRQSIRSDFDAAYRGSIPPIINYIPSDHKLTSFPEIFGDNFTETSDEKNDNPFDFNFTSSNNNNNVMNNNTTQIVSTNTNISNNSNNLISSEDTNENDSNMSIPFKSFSKFMKKVSGFNDKKPTPTSQPTNNTPTNSNPLNNKTLNSNNTQLPTINETNPTSSSNTFDPFNLLGDYDPAAAQNSTPPLNLLNTSSQSTSQQIPTSQLQSMVKSIVAEENKQLISDYQQMKQSFDRLQKDYISLKQSVYKK